VPAPDGGDGATVSFAETPSARHVLATARGVGFTTGGQFFAFASRFAISIVLAHTLGARDYGLYALAISAATLTSGISLLGLDDAMVRYVAILSGRRDDAGIRGTIQIGMGLAVAAGLLLAGVLFVAAGPIAVGLFHEPELGRSLRLLAIVVPFLAASNVLLGTTRGFGRMDYAAFGEQVAPSAIRLVLVLLLALFGHLNLVVSLVVFGIADVASSFVMVLLLHRVFPLDRPFRREARRDVNEVMRFALPLWVSGLLRQFRRNIQNVMLGALSTVANVGIFTIVGNVNLVASVVSQSVYVSVRPILARLHDRGDREGLTHLYTTSTRWTFALNVPFFLVTVLYPEAILAVFGGQFTSGATALVVMGFAQLANAATGICQPVIDMTGHTRVKLANTVLLTILLVGSGALLIPRWDIVGAAVASLIAMAVVNVLCVAEVWYLERILPFDRTFLKPIVAGTGAWVLGVVLDRWHHAGADIGMAALQAAVVCGAFVVACLVSGLAPEDRLVVDRVARRLHLPRVLLGERAA
jgi:O-antigen/teichoic acid export membrane protein